MDLQVIRFYLLGGAVLTSFLILFLGIFIFVKNIRGALNRNFFIATLGLSGWILCAVHGFYNIYQTKPVLPFISFRLIWACSIYIGFAMMNFAFYYPPRSKSINPRREILIYLIPIFLSIFFFIGTPDGVMKVDDGSGQIATYPVRRAMMMDLTIRNGTLVNVKMDLLRGPLLYAFPLLGSMLITIILLLMKFKKQIDIQGRNKLKLIGLGVFLTTILAWPFGNLLPMFFDNINFYGIALISPIIVFGFMAYSIVKYKALEIETVIHKTIMWLIVTSLLVIPIIIIIFPFYNYLKVAGPTLITIIVAGLVYIFHWIYGFVQPKINRWFERNKVNCGLLFQYISQNILSSSNREYILETVQSNAIRELHSEFAFSMLLNPDYKYQFVSHAGKLENKKIDILSSKSYLINYLHKEGKVLEGVFVRNSPEFTDLKEEGFFSRYNVEVVVPYKFKDRLFGFLCLGRKTNLKDYTNDEIKMFDNLIKNIGLSLFNAENHELFLRNKLLERDLAIATDIQKSLLPTNKYIVEGLSIKALSKPLAIVSGDYYDIKEISNDRVLVLILDVSGKGVSAALVMVMIQTVFMNHLLFYENLSKLANNINTVLLSQLKGEKYATAIFLEINKKKGDTRVLNCGHHPLALIDANGKVFKVESNALPIGLMDSMNEKVTKFKFPKGGLALMYTDGFPELQNEKGEQFGDDRMIEVSKKNMDKNPEAIVNILFESASEHQKNQKQVDDMTAIAIKKT
ncbi:MAG: SpoIIE family protein phosphatase [Spirochaetes bacterium]|nr:SpoIIE family protein phosphatase [Spirochaetota bacterium]